MTTRFLALLLSAMSCAVHFAGAGQIELVTRRNPGSPPVITGEGSSIGASLSADGRFVVFVSDVPTLVDNDANGFRPDVFRRDLKTGTTELVSVGPDGKGWSNWIAFAPSISADGSKVAFTIQQITPDGANERPAQVYVRDMLLKSTELVSKGRSGTTDGDLASHNPVISGDGRFVAFESEATNLTEPRDTNYVQDIYLRDLASGAFWTVSSRGGWRPNGFWKERSSPQISHDGSIVAFLDPALDYGESVEGKTSLMLWNRISGKAERVTIPFPTSAVAEVQLFNMDPAGTRVGFRADGLGKQGGSFCGLWDVGRRSAEFVVKSADSVDTVGLNPTTWVTHNERYVGSGPVLSADGRTAAFTLLSTNSVDPAFRIHIWQQGRGIRTLAEIATETGAPNSPEPQHSTWPELSADGSKLLFLSTNVNAGTDTNLAGELRAYVRDLTSGETVPLPEGNFEWSVPELSRDGSKVVFQSMSPFGNADKNEDMDVFLTDLRTGTTGLVSGLSHEHASSTASALAKSMKLSADGRFVFYLTEAGDALSQSLKPERQLVRWDRTRNLAELVSATAEGTAAGVDRILAITSDGNSALFTAEPGRYAKRSTNSIRAAYLKNLTSGTVSPIETSAFPPEDVGREFRAVTGSMSANGQRVVVAVARADRAEVERQNYIIVWDQTTGGLLLTNKVSVATTPYMSPDGSFAAWRGDGWGAISAYSWERQSVETIRENSKLNLFGLSPNGRWVVANDIATNVQSNPWLNRYPPLFTITDLAQHIDRQVPLRIPSRFSVANNGDIVFSTIEPMAGELDANGAEDVYRYDQELGELELVSHSRSGFAAEGGGSGAASISDDGRFIAYRSWATNLVDGDLNGTADIFVYDAFAKRTQLLSDTGRPGNPPNGPSYGPQISADGKVVAFFSQANNLVENDFNEAPDIFVVPVAPQAGSLDALRSALATDGALLLRWPSSPGVHYRIVRLADVQSLVGGETLAEIEGTGGFLRYQVPEPAPDQTFLRVIQVD